MGRARPRWCDFLMRQLYDHIALSKASTDKQTVFDHAVERSISILKSGEELGHCIQSVFDSAYRDLLVRLYVASTLSLDAWVEADVGKAELMVDSLCYVDKLDHRTLYRVSIAEVRVGSESISEV